MKNIHAEKMSLPQQIIENISEELVKNILSNIEQKLDNVMFLSYTNSKGDEFVTEALMLFDYIYKIPDNSIAIDSILGNIKEN